MADLRATWSRRTDTADGVAVEVECHHRGADGDHMFRAIDLLTIADGAITGHVEYCTGDWSPEDVAAQR
jgi:ketosteroid isomerase-like protein